MNISFLTLPCIAPGQIVTEVTSVGPNLTSLRRMRTISEDTRRNLALPEANWPRDTLIGGRSLQKLFLINIPTRTTSLTKVFRTIARREVVNEGPVFVCVENFFLTLLICYTESI